MSNVRAYWEMETKHTTVCDVMSPDQFLKLLTLIHFQDNLKVSDETKKDKDKNYKNNLFAYLLKNVMQLMQFTRATSCS